MSDVDIEAITAADLFHTAYRRHLEGIGVWLHPRVPFETCDAHPCVLWRAALRAGTTGGAA